MQYNYNDLLSVERFRESTYKRSSDLEEFYSDRSRIIYSTSFRKLQKKAQVFCLEPNTNVRTRLTHSIEVSDLGRTLASKIGYKLVDQGLIEECAIPKIVSIVENACLVHDIGNPPFGHFGEVAIQKWSRDNLKHYAENASVDIHKHGDLFKSLISDFEEFDGNPQGFRIVTGLHCEGICDFREENYSLNLTYSTLACCIKYCRAPGEEKRDGIYRKPGYFVSEKDKVLKLYEKFGFVGNRRYPFTYIMEAADDIAYCLSDISDGLEKKIIDEHEFLVKFKEIWDRDNKGVECPVPLPEKIDSFNLDIAIDWSRKMMDNAVDNFISNQEIFFDGYANQLIPKDGMGRVLKVIREISRTLIYGSQEAENIELTGYSVLIGLLDAMGALLKMDYSNFKLLLKDGSRVGLGLESRLFNKIDKRYVTAYRCAVYGVDESNDTFTLREWWLRVHLLVDYISGMTDDDALLTYQIIHGVKGYQ